jgi:formylglycine-generating enzyme required for sulfatase activity
LLNQLERDELSHEQRALIGRVVTQFGDPRKGVGLREDGLPDLDWVEIPGGRVKLEKVNRVFDVKPFRISRYLVTNGQFEAFIKAEDGYRDGRWWLDMKPCDESDAPSWNEDNCPRETVSWCEAVAFCRWLSQRLGGTVRLLTEWEWQQAATGGDAKNEYPWPGGWDPARCNGATSHLNRTTAVGVYPNGATTQRAMDMAGNLWEWCVNKYDKLRDPAAMKIDGSNDARVIRGGSWDDTSVDLRASFRDRGVASDRYDSIGFRLAQDIE